MRSKLPVIAALLGGAAIALIVVLLVGGGDDDKSGDKAATRKPAALADGVELKGDQFKLRYPKKGWQKLTQADLGKRASGALAGVKRQDNNAIVVVQKRGKLDQPLDQIAPDLTKQLKKSVKDFKFVGSEQVKLPAGDAVTYTFVRTKTNRIQNLVVVPSGSRTYTLNSVIGGESQDAARQVPRLGVCGCCPIGANPASQVR